MLLGKKWLLWALFKFFINTQQYLYEITMHIKTIKNRVRKILNKQNKYYAYVHIDRSDKNFTVQIKFCEAAQKSKQTSYNASLNE
ncbi:hypothetical protein BOW52_10340 [Solemya elarraichensis gill symbiont]|uniref:Uncharacterized protein n=1 Tax=Solemya elarraichensis gill symbiont TaxID=1918949 RepID=A0A1T2KWH0_9GAMM|nr:hypothetical protein BOW52_10340 [Solemya elarraichensis gill symbiont]